MLMVQLHESSVPQEESPVTDQRGDGPGTNLRHWAVLAHGRRRLAYWLLLRAHLTGSGSLLLNGRRFAKDDNSEGLLDLLRCGLLGDALGRLLGFGNLELVEGSVSESKENYF